MPRARNIKPSFFTNEVIGQLDPIVSLLFIGLWCLADKDGTLEDRPLRIKAELFPYRDGLDVNGYLTVLQRAGFIVRYEVACVGYIHILNFHKHQHPHHTENSKGYPKPPQECLLTPLTNGCTPSDSLIPDSLIPDSNTLSCKQDDTLTSSSHEVIDFLNSKTGCHYRKTGTTQKFVLARLKDGYSVQDMKTVIAKKCREWINDPAMVSYLRPKTLFNATNFENYHGQCVEVPND